MTRLFTLCIAGLVLGACSHQSTDPKLYGTAAERLKPLTTPLPEPSVRRTVYVPVYSNIYLGLNEKPRPTAIARPSADIVALAATVSVRNVSPRYPLVLNFVRYYDSAGKHVRDYVSTPSELGPLATVEFVIQQMDMAGGPGANFLVQWAGPTDIDEPLVEAVMVGQSGSAGISFTSVGRVVKNEPPQ
jgi:hypothetical protein